MNFFTADDDFWIILAGFLILADHSVRFRLSCQLDPVITPTSAPIADASQYSKSEISPPPIPINFTDAGFIPDEIISAQ